MLVVELDAPGLCGEAGPDRGGALPSERLSERLLRRGRDWLKRFRIRFLKDVAWGPRVETGATVPGSSGGFAACAVVSYSGLL